MGKDKPAVVEGLRLLRELGVEVAAVVGAENASPTYGASLVESARALGIPTVGDATLYELLERPDSDRKAAGLDLRGLDVVISYLFWKRIQRPAIAAPRLGCINFHAAPLPDFRGVAGYSIAVLEGLPAWGVSAHFVDDGFDTGDIIRVDRFAIDPERETAWSLEKLSMRKMLALFGDLVRDLLQGKTLPRAPQDQGNARYIRREEFESLRRIAPGDTAAQIDRKIRAFWFPPYGGACIERDGREYTVIDRALLERIGELYRAAERAR